MANPKPVAEVRIGTIKAAVWRNETANSTRHNVTFSRLYKDGDQWKTTQSLLATICSCWRKWPIRPTRVSSSSSRKNSRSDRKADSHRQRRGCPCRCRILHSWARRETEQIHTKTTEDKSLDCNKTIQWLKEGLGL